MEIRIRQTGKVVTDSEFRAMFPNTGFPAQLTADIISEFGGDVVLEGPQAQPTRYQVAFRDGVQQIEGQWFTKYSVADMDQAAKDAVDAQLKESNRARAKAALEDTDWCENASVRDTSVTPHLTNGAAFDAYRLALRAIVINPPIDVESWPEQPQGVWVS